MKDSKAWCMCWKFVLDFEIIAAELSAGVTPQCHEKLYEGESKRNLKG